MLDVKIKYPQASQVIELFFKGWGGIKLFIYFTAISKKMKSCLHIY